MARCKSLFIATSMASSANATRKTLRRRTSRRSSWKSRGARHTSKKTADAKRKRPTAPSDSSLSRSLCLCSKAATPQQVQLPSPRQKVSSSLALPTTLRQILRLSTTRRRKMGKRSKKKAVAGRKRNSPRCESTLNSSRPSTTTTTRCSCTWRRQRLRKVLICSSSFSSLSRVR